MENGTTGAVKGDKEGLNTLLASGSTKIRAQVLRNLQVELGSGGLFDTKRIKLCSMLIVL